MEISELSETLKAIMEIACEGIIVVNDSGVITMVNQVYADFFGKAPEEMIGKHVSDAYFDAKLSRLPVVLKTGKAEVGRTFFMKGHRVIVSRVPVFRDGKIIGAIGKMIFMDLAVFEDLARKAASVKKRPMDDYKLDESKYDIDKFIGNNQAILDLKHIVRNVAIRNSTVLIQGESGTGKEVLAHAIHSASNRRLGPFIKVNCAAIPENLLESELFGYGDGAFTGARKGGQIGKFEQASNGTIFLDEIGDMPLTMQAKLLRVLQEKEVEPLGTNQPRKVDVRIIAATNVQIENLIKNGKFREDLYYRLNVVNLNIPPLRDRMDDLPLLIEFFMEKYNHEFGLEVSNISSEVLGIFNEYPWPGNVREFSNVMERIFNIVDGPLITKNHLPLYLINYRCRQETVDKIPGGTLNLKELLAAQKNTLGQGQDTLIELVEKAEKEIITKALSMCKGNKAKAACFLGISRQGLYKKLDKYGIG